LLHAAAAGLCRTPGRAVGAEDPAATAAARVFVQLQLAVRAGAYDPAGEAEAGV
jgi:hypothetical protein